MSDPKQRHIMHNESSEVYPVADGEIDFGELLGILWRGKWIILSAGLVAGIIAIALTLMMPNIYRSETVLAPVDETGTGGLEALAGQLGGLASLAGFRVGKGQASKITIALEVLKSRLFITDFIKRHNIMVPLMATKKWDPVNKRVIIDPDIYDVKAKRWMVHYKNSNKNGPSDWQAYKTFRKMMIINQDKETGLITVSLDNKSPILARQWLDWLISDINSEIRKRDIDEAEKSIDYLNAQREKTALAGMQQIFYKLIEKQTQTIMLANVRDQYVLRIIDPPEIPEVKHSPKRAIIVILTVAFVLMLVSFVLLVLRMSRR